MIQLKWSTLGRRQIRGIFSGDTSWLSLLLIALFLAMTWGGTLHWIARDRATAERDAEVAAQNVSGVYSVQMLRALRDIDLTINVVRYACEQKGLLRSLSNLETDLLVPTALLFTINVTDQKGRNVATNNSLDEPVDASDQPHFLFFRDSKHQGDRLYVGPAVLNKETGNSRMKFARRLNDAKGGFAGVVSVSINPDYFTSDYETTRLGDGGTLGVIAPDGHLLVARSGDRIIRDMGGNNASLTALLSTKPESGRRPVNVTQTPWDGVARYTATAHLSAFGITTVAGLSEHEQLASFHRRERTYLWQATLVSVLVVVLGVLLRQLLRSRSRVRRAQETYHAASEASQDAAFVLHSLTNAAGELTDFLLTDANSRGVALLGLDKAAMLGRPLSTLLPPPWDRSVFAVLSRVVNTAQLLDQEWENHVSAIKAEWLHAQVVKAGNGVVAIVRDISERKRFEAELVSRNTELTVLNRRLTETHEQLVQSEKLASIGLLAAGVAHEINNPIGFVLSNIGTLDGYIHGLFDMLEAYGQAEKCLSDPAVLGRIKALKTELELAYLKDDIPALMRETKDGVERVRKIVKDLKDFSHLDNTQEWQMANLHDGIDSTLNVVNNELKYKADIIKQYGDMPLVECLPSEINQVVMNLLVNAAHAMGEERGAITVRTGHDACNAWFEVEDTGSGISPENLAKIFDPFFTTKPVGKGTGLGLSLSYGIIKKHAGRMEVSSQLGKGTVFKVTLPLLRAEQLEEGVQPALAEAV